MRFYYEDDKIKMVDYWSGLCRDYCKLFVLQFVQCCGVSDDERILF